MDEVVLLKRFRAGEPTAAWRIVREHGQALHAIGYRIAGDPDTAQDIVQETLVRAMTSAEMYRGGSLRAWLSAIAARTALNTLRRETRIRSRESLYAAQHEAAERPGDPLLRHRLRVCFARLPPSERAVFVMTQIEGWSHRETAAALGMSEAMSRQHLFKARGELREALRDLHPEE